MTPDDAPRFSGFHSYADGRPRDDDPAEPAPAGVVYWNETPTYLEDDAAPDEAGRQPRRLALFAGATAAGLAVIGALGWSLLPRAPPAPLPASTGPGVQVVVTEPPPPPALPKTDRLEVLPSRTAVAAVMPAPNAAPSPSSPQVAIDASTAASPPPVAISPPPPLAAIPPPAAPERQAWRAAPAPRNGFSRCADAPTAAQRMVCGDMRVAAADQRMKAAYAAALDAGVPYRRLALDQDEWMEVREDAAHVSRGAVLDVYRQRTRELWAMADGRD